MEDLFFEEALQWLYEAVSPVFQPSFIDPINVGIEDTMKFESLFEIFNVEQELPICY